MLIFSAQYPPVEPPRTPQLAASVPTRNAPAIDSRRSLVKYVSTCGPPGTSMHSVSRGGATVGRISTMIVGTISLRSIALAATVGMFMRVTRLRASPG